MTIANYLKKKKVDKSTLLMDHLHNAMYDTEKPRSQKQIHASHVTNEFCPRELIIVERDKVQLKAHPVPPPLRYTFDEGNDKQYRFNNDWMRPYHYGHWKCRICATEHTGYHPKDDPENDTSESCYAPEHQWEYQEMVFKDPVSGIIGSVDSILKLSSADPFLMVELKIMKGEDFRDLIAPLAEHTLRTMLYLYLIAHDKKNQMRKKMDLTKAHVLYMARGYGYKHADHGVSPFKDFVVERNDALVMPYVNKGYAATIARKEKLLPMRVCDSMTCPRAKKCPVSKQCWSQPAGTLSWANAKGEALHQNAEVVACAEVTSE
jgi:hypothetical protein